MTAVRRLLLGFIASLALAAAALVAPAGPAATSAQAQVTAEFQEALSPYGHWERLARWGEVWVPDGTPPDWQPYRYGHWVYTDEWGWYWISDPEEEDWGWVVYHYGRWAHDRRVGWFWIPDDEWAPAWVDWRYGDGYVGWAPLPPDPLIYVYDDDPAYWLFVGLRFLTAPRLHAYYQPHQRRASIFRRSHVINRTLRYERNRAAVNPGLSPALAARGAGRALPTYRVSPHVLTGTRGVAGAVRISPQEARARRGSHPRAVAVQPSSVTIKPAATASAPPPLTRNERGRLGSHPPRAAQGGAAQPLQQTQPAQPQTKQPQIRTPQVQPSRPAPAQPQVRTPQRVTPPPQPTQPTPARPTPPAVRQAPPPHQPQVRQPSPQRPPQAARPQRPPQAAHPQRPPQAAKPQPGKQPQQGGRKPPEKKGDGKKPEPPK